MKPKPKTPKRRPARSKDKLVIDLVAALSDAAIISLVGWMDASAWGANINQRVARALRALYERETGK